MKTINIKPLSVNKAYIFKKGTKGRIKSPEYRAYAKHVTLLLRPMIIPDGQIIAFYEFGVSSVLFDTDNGVKIFQDILQAKFRFNDNKIYDFWASKRIVKKGQEYIKYDLLPADKFKIEIKDIE